VSSDHGTFNRNRARWQCTGQCGGQPRHLALGQEARGHVVAQLLQDLPMSASADLIDKARALDNFLVATRYADGHPAGAPFEHYGRLQSGQAIAYAGEILDFARAEMARPRGG